MVCYVCGDPAPKRSKLPGERKPTSALSNLLFIASLGLTGYSFIAGHSLSLVFSLTASGVILIARLFDWMRKQDRNSKLDKLADRSAWVPMRSRG